MHHVTAVVSGKRDISPQSGSQGKIGFVQDSDADDYNQKSYYSQTHFSDVIFDS
jgi:hypothetical protein